MFGGYSNSNIANSQNSDTVESLRQELRDAKAEIHKLKQALGSNHKLGYRSGGLLG